MLGKSGVFGKLWKVTEEVTAEVVAHRQHGGERSPEISQPRGSSFAQLQLAGI